MTITINDDFSSHIVSVDGTMECFLSPINPETLQPFGSKEEVEAFIPQLYANQNYWMPYKTPEEREQISNAEKSLANVSRAKYELANTDWVENSSVRDTTVNPHLTNVSEFDAYRLALRSIAVNKPSTVATWPSAPTAIWSSGT